MISLLLYWDELLSEFKFASSLKIYRLVFLPIYS